jgi:hypothetical protein
MDFSAAFGDESCSRVTGKKVVVFISSGVGMAKKKRKGQAASASELLGGAITDWGGFEQFVAELNKTGDVVVEHNVTLNDRSGTPRQIDVLIRHRQGLIEHVVICECKFWNTNVSREKVDALITTVKELNASKGVVFSVKGFQSGAVTTAAANGISLFKVREPSQEEWGAPGRHVDFYLSLVSVSLGSLEFPGAATIASVPQPNIALNIALGPNPSATAAFVPGVNLTTTLEKIIEDGSRAAARQVYDAQIARESPPWFGGGTGERYIRSTASLVFNPALFLIGNSILLPAIKIQIGVLVVQSRLQIDRAKSFTFAVAVEDVVSKSVKSATRRPGQEITALAPLLERVGAEADGALRNGSMITAWVRDFQPFYEFAGLADGEVDDRPLSAAYKVAGT